MKTLIASVLAFFTLAGTAMAGSVAYVAPAAPMVESTESMGSSGFWIIPLLAIALIALAISQNDDDTPTPAVVAG